MMSTLCTQKKKKKKKKKKRQEDNIYLFQKTKDLKDTNLSKPQDR
jgi:hypothetical protein